jgi:hypothetical protein
MDANVSEECMKEAGFFKILVYIHVTSCHNIPEVISHGTHYLESLRLLKLYFCNIFKIACVFMYFDKYDRRKYVDVNDILYAISQKMQK